MPHKLFILGVFVGPFVIIIGLFIWARLDKRKRDKRDFAWMEKNKPDNQIEHHQLEACLPPAPLKNLRKDSTAQT
jgi:hypothetical protein